MKRRPAPSIVAASRRGLKTRGWTVRVTTAPTGVVTATAFVACAILALPAGRYVGRKVVEDAYRNVEGMDVFFACVFGFMAMWLFPFVYAWMIVERLAGGDMESMGASLFGESREKKMARREDAVLEREARLARLERDLGVK